MPVQDNARFDFIVVGGNTAGNVVAGRLSENLNAKILVAEAGVVNSKDIEAIRAPLNAMELRNSEYDWAYKSTMVKRDDYERIEKPKIAARHLVNTFNMWEEYGGKEWTREPFVHYLRKCVTYLDDPEECPPEMKKIGENGPIPISHSDLIPKMKPFRTLFPMRGSPLVSQSTRMSLTVTCRNIPPRAVIWVSSGPILPMYGGFPEKSRKFPSHLYRTLLAGCLAYSDNLYIVF
ncbi:hypothetical protein PENCOP_c008G02738 [Penicillium coprophilum]|uniref:Uncharacterized protein n=1 Tax=Penicillium coprophilum TaxID=36646 RepID=A0A1V6UJJ7_9EURO|nr:hypothetical protein PENCOP_c008G02738 [Penicillium coprophilum]